MAAWRLFVAKTVTGQVVADLPLSAPPTYGYGLDLAGAWQVSVALSSVDQGYLWSLMDMYRYSWGVAYGNLILQCGPATAATYTDDATATLQVTGTGIWGLLSAKRLLINSTWTSATSVALPSADVNLGPASLHTIAKLIVANDLARARHSLPIVLPDDIAGSNVRNYPGYDLAFVGQRLEELTQDDQGPEVEFRPEWTDSTQTAVQWRMRIGNPNLGFLGFQHAFDYGKGLTKLDLTIDGTSLTTGHFTKGVGSDRALTYGYAESSALTSAGWPALEDADSDHTSASVQSTLNGWATAHLSAYGVQVQIGSIVIRLDGTDGRGVSTGSPSIDLIAVGDNATLNIRGHRLLPDSTRGVRILAIDNGPDINTAKLTVQDLR